MDSTTDRTTETTAASPEELRAQMVATVQQRGYGLRPEVERVLLDTPRHEFVPDATLQAAHNPWQAVITHRFSDGRSLSCISAPFVVAMMLDQLAVQPGNRVLEIADRRSAFIDNCPLAAQPILDWTTSHMMSVSGSS